MTRTTSARTMDRYNSTPSFSVSAEPFEDGHLAVVKTNDNDDSYVYGLNIPGNAVFEVDFSGIPAGSVLRSISYLARATGGTFWIGIRPLNTSGGEQTAPHTGSSPPTYTSFNNSFTYFDEVLNTTQAVQFRFFNESSFQARLTYATVSLTYSPAPNAPTLVSPLGLSPGLSPTLQVSPSNPTGGDTITHTEYEVRRVSNNAAMWASGFLSGNSTSYGGLALADGVQYKWRARSRNTHGAIGAWSSFQNFTPTSNTAPSASAIAPIGSVGSLTPTVSLGFTDAGDTFAKYQIQVRRKSDSVSFWDTGLVDTSGAQKTARRADVTYAGTTLVNGTEYEWRGRVQDAGGLNSNYTAWTSFTPALQPNAPTGLEPSGLTDTLTPTIEGAYSQGGGQSEAAFQYEIRQGTTTIYQSGDVATAIATGQAYGTDNSSDTPSSPPALAWGTSYDIRARSKDSAGAYSAWTSWQPFNTNAAPTTPTNLSPSGSITADTTPTLSWTHNDPDGDAQTEADIELREVEGDAAVSGYDPKTLSQATTTHDVTETLTNSPSTEYRWRVRTKGLSGPGFGPWSDWQTFIVATAPTVTLTDPDPSDVIDGPALLVTWSFSGGSGTQQDFRVVVYAEDGSTIVYDTEVTAGTSESHQLAAGILKNGRTYYVQVTARDTLNVSGQTDKVLFTTSWALPPTITGFTVEAIGSQE